MAKVVSMAINMPGMEMWVNYNAANLCIITVEWTIPVSGHWGNINIAMGYLVT